MQPELESFLWLDMLGFQDTLNRDALSMLYPVVRRNRYTLDDC